MCAGTSDPFVKFTLLGGDEPPTVQTAPVANATDPAWEDTLELALPAGFSGEGELRVRVWDDDVTKDDDAIGSAVSAPSDVPIVHHAPIHAREL